MSNVTKEIEDLLSRVPDPSTIALGDRRCYKVDYFRSGYGGAEQQRLTPAAREDADVVSSEVYGARDMHVPTLDIDLPCTLVESGTPGHYHLYIDKPLTWKQYDKLLKALVEAGIVEEGFYRMSKEKRASYLRLPEKPKGASNVKPSSHSTGGGYWY